jgi:hypothetical protein
MKIPNVELWLINNTEKEIKRFQGNWVFIYMFDLLIEVKKMKTMMGLIK